MTHEEEPSPGWAFIQMIADGLVLMIRALAFQAEAFLHVGFGPKYIDAQAAAAPALAVAFGLFWPEYDLIPLLAFLGMFSLLSAAAVSDVRRTQSRRVQLPDYYSGRPRLMRSGRWFAERTIKRLVEPVGVFLIGWALQAVEEPLGVYLIFVAAALFISVNVHWGFARTREFEGVIDPNKPIRVQVRRVPRASAQWVNATSSARAYGGQS